jgi:hypothetical protein
VNVLCGLYEEGFNDNIEQSRKQLQSLVTIAKERGYPDGINILAPSLAADYVRKICWNISSLLTDMDFKRYGVPIDGRKKPSG